jgi:hypothetical protein
MRVYLPYLLFSLVLGIGFFVGEQYLHLNWITTEWRALLAFFLSVSLLTSRLHSAGYQRTEKHFALLPLAATVLRLILSLVFFGIMLRSSLPDQTRFVVTFLVLYLFYLGFEIAVSNRNLRPNS